MTKVEFKVDETGEAKRLIDNGIKAMTTFQAPLAAVEVAQQNSIKNQFSTQGSTVTGSKWAKRTRPYSHPILNKTGNLKKSFQSKITSFKLEITSRIKYYRYHQQGTKKMSQRQILGFSKSMVTEAVTIFINYIKRTLNG